jgi:hypothetical protein
MAVGTRLLKNKLTHTKIDDLPQQQQAFVLALLSTSPWNFSEAARLAKYKHPAIAANKLIHNPKVAAVLGREMRMRNERARMTNDEVLAQIEYEAFCDILDLCDEDGHIVVDSLRDVPVEMRRCINGVEVTERTYVVNEEPVTERKIKFRLVDKLGAQQMLLKHRGLIAPSETNVTLNLGVVQQVLGERVEERGKSHAIEARIEQEKEGG